MVHYELYDKYGKRVASVTAPVQNFETVVVEHEGRFYRPICYALDMNENIAKCVPVAVVNASTGEISEYESVH